ncbi:MAG: GAF domain-containing protein, partial [Thermoplasmatota archaeon]
FVITSRDITSERKAWKELETRERILRSISSLSEDLIRGGGSMDPIVHAMKDMGEALDISRVYVFQNHRTKGGKVLTSQVQEWVANGISPQIDNPDLQNTDMLKDGFSRWVRELSSGRPIKGPVGKFPEKERRYLEMQDIRSILVVPIMSGNEWWGFMGFDDCRSEREWSAPEIEALKTAANIFGYGLQLTK